jgi:hypothetical protein
MTQPPTMISDAVLAVENSKNIATDTPPSSLTHLSTSPLPSLDSKCSDPFQPSAWRGLTSIVHKPRCWQLASSMPLKSMKMPLQFRRPIISETRSCASSLKVSDSSKPLLPKGWVYAIEEVGVKVEAEVADPNLYQILDAPFMRSKCKALGPPDDPPPQSQLASSIIEAPHSFPSVSEMSMAVKRWRITSAPTLMPLTLL